MVATAPSALSSNLNRVLLPSLFQVDAAVITEIATMTDPDCLGPMDPGASVTLEGIVWHETENGE